MEFNLKNSVIFLISLCVVVLFLFLIINDNKKSINPDNIKVTKNNYIEYRIDDLVKLKNNSYWYVLYNSDNKEKEIYLISKDKINDEVITNINHYIKDEYLDKLCNSLFISRNEISDIRLLSISDICDLYDISVDEFNNRFDRTKYKLLENDTVVDYYEDNKQLSLCNEGLCNNDNNSIRVVIKIPKFFIEENEKEE